MSMEDFFKKREQNMANSNRTNWGGVGSLPALGSIPAQPALPETNIPANQPKIAPPSAESIIAANDVIALYSPHMKDQNNGR